MNRDTLYNIFKSPYQSSIWKGFLKELFRDISASYFQTPVDLKDESTGHMVCTGRLTVMIVPRKIAHSSIFKFN
jgi:hypothetical protein